MRYALALAILALTASLAHAQQPVAPPSSIGLPLPPIGLPLPTIGLPPAEAAPMMTPGTPKPPLPVPLPAQPIVVFGIAPPAWGYEAWQLSPAPGVIAQPPPRHSAAGVEVMREVTGVLRLEIKPAGAQVFVDGEFFGTVTDLNGEVELRPGTRHVELRAPRHETLTVDVRVVAGREVTYRGALTPLDEPRRPAPPPAPAPAKAADPGDRAPRDTKPAPPAKFYLIPGCYLGNIPPDQIKLPAGCDLSRMITHTPAR